MLNSCLKVVGTPGILFHIILWNLWIFFRNLFSTFPIFSFILFFSPNEGNEINRVHKPHPMRHILKSDFTHTFKGTIAGLIIMGAAIINLVLFFGFDGEFSRLSRFF